MLLLGARPIQTTERRSGVERPIISPMMCGEVLASVSHIQQQSRCREHEVIIVLWFFRFPGIGLGKRRHPFCRGRWGGLAENGFRTHCVRSAGKYLGMPPVACGLWRGLQHATETRRLASFPRIPDNITRYIRVYRRRGGRRGQIFMAR